jgi:TP901-1 family phage major tail protein
MAAQTGREVLIKIESAVNGTFNTIAGMKSKSISFNGSTVDVTDSDSTDRWRELLGGAGIRTAQITGSGVFKDSTTEGDVRALFFGAEIDNFQFIIPSFGTFAGLFQVTSLEYAGEHNGEATYSMTFESAGAIVWTAA